MNDHVKGEHAGLSIAVRTALATWKQNMAQFDKSLATLSDADLQREIAPGRNRVYYLLGHLTAVHDRLLPMLRVGQRMHPGLDEEFITQPDGAVTKSGTTPAALRTAWSEVNARLIAAVEAWQPSEWLERHDAVSPEDFATNPLRNRLAVFLSRASHLAMHDGQVRLAIPRS